MRDGKPKIDKNDPFASLIQTLENMNRQMESSASSNDSLRKVIEQSYKIKAEHGGGDHKHHSFVTKNVYGKNAPSILQEISNTEKRVSEYEMKGHRTDVENVQRMLDLIIVKPFKGIEKSFRKMLTATEETTNRITDKEYLEPVRHQDVLTQKGLGGSMRRGMLDLHGDLPEAKTIGEKAGRLTGKLWAGVTGIDTDTRKAYARESYYTEIEHARATNKDPEKRNKLLGHEHAQLADIEYKARTGLIDTKGVSVEKYMEEARKQIVQAHNLKAMEVRDPEGTQKEQAKLRVAVGIPQETRYFKKDDNAGFSYKEFERKEPNFHDDDHEEMHYRGPDIHAIHTPTEIRIPTRQERESQRDTNTGRAFTPVHDDDDGLAESINVAIKTGDFNVKNFKVNEFKIKTLTIEQLIKPTSPEEQSGAANSNPMPDGGQMIPDIDIDRRRGRVPARGAKGALKGAMKAGARLLGKMALPIAGLMAAGDGISGYMNAEDNLGIEGRKATFGEKMSSAAGGIVSGLSMGVLDEKSAGKGIASFFGAGPDVSPKNESVKAETIKPKTGNDINTTPDKKQVELATVKSENDMLKREEKDASGQKQNNVLINSPTNIVNKSSGQNTQTVVRPTHNAYERFVDRVFTA